MLSQNLVGKINFTMGTFEIQFLSNYPARIVGLTFTQNFLVVSFFAKKSLCEDFFSSRRVSRNKIKNIYTRSDFLTSFTWQKCCKFQASKQALNTG